MCHSLYILCVSHEESSIAISLLKRKGYFNNGLATRVASDMLHTVMIGNNVLLIEYLTWLS